MSYRLENYGAAPDLALASQTGQGVNLMELVGRKWFILCLYPKNRPSGRKAETCAFRDSYGLFKQCGAEVVGVSSIPRFTQRCYTRLSELERSGEDP